MKCKAKLFIADDYGDNHATMKCQLEEGHEGKHKEDFNRAIVEWAVDESHLECITEEEEIEFEKDE